MTQCLELGLGLSFPEAQPFKGGWKSGQNWGFVNEKGRLGRFEVGNQWCLFQMNYKSLS